MPWVSPSLDSLRGMNRDNIQSMLRSGPMIPNSGMRVMADANAALAFYTLLYISWLALQLMPDTAETEWLDRHASIWLTQGRKAATFAVGVATATGIVGTPIGAGAQFNGDNNTFLFSSNSPIVLGPGPTNISFTALIPGVTGLSVGDSLSFASGISGVAGTVTIISFTDGVDGESDDDLRVRVLDRIREPPMGGDAFDYVQWALAFPGCTRAWCAPQEMGIGTVTVRFMMDAANAGPLVLDGGGNPVSGGGFPLSADVAAMAAYLNTKRPVTVKSFFVAAPIPWLLNFTVSNLLDGSAATKANITVSVTNMLFQSAAPSSSANGVLLPATTIWAAWVSQAILSAPGVVHFDFTAGDFVPPNNGSLALLGTITYV